MSKMLDWYLKFPLLIDFFIGGAVFISDYKYDWIAFKYLEYDKLLDYISNIISTDVGLAGFIIAALTIITAFKSNSRARGDDENMVNMMDLFLNPERYMQIVNIFKNSIIELLINILGLYVVWIASANFKVSTISAIALAAVITTVFTLFRCVYILSSMIVISNNRQRTS